MLTCAFRWHIHLNCEMFQLRMNHNYLRISGSVRSSLLVDHNVQNTRPLWSIIILPLQLLFSSDCRASRSSWADELGWTTLQGASRPNSAKPGWQSFKELPSLYKFCKVGQAGNGWQFLELAWNGCQYLKMAWNGLSG